MTIYYINRETGEFLTYEEMVMQGKELYGMDDPSDSIDYLRYYKKAIW